MDTKVMPNAQKDKNAFLRDMLEEDKPLRLMTFMFRKKLGLLFKKSCVKTDPQDPTPPGYMSLHMFSDCMSAANVPLSLKDMSLIFLQSQSEDFEEFEGDVDTDMSYDEFLEAILRIGVHLAGKSSSLATDEMFHKVANMLVGELEGEKIKLSWQRYEELVELEKLRLEDEKVKYMWEQFEAKEGDMSEGMKEILRQLDPENMFKNLLPVLEAEGDRAYKATKALRSPGKLKAAGGTKMGSLLQKALARPASIGADDSARASTPTGSPMGRRMSSVGSALPSIS